MIKIVFSNKKEVKKAEKVLNKLLRKNYLTETIHDTIWFKGLYFKVFPYSIEINVFDNNFISEENVKRIIKQLLKNKHSYVLCYNNLQFYIDNLISNEKMLQIL